MAGCRSRLSWSCAWSALAAGCLGCAGFTASRRRFWRSASLSGFFGIGLFGVRRAWPLVRLGRYNGTSAHLLPELQRRCFASPALVVVLPQAWWTAPGAAPPWGAAPALAAARLGRRSRPLSWRRTAWPVVAAFFVAGCAVPPVLPRQPESELAWPWFGRWRRNSAPWPSSPWLLRAQEFVSASSQFPFVHSSYRIFATLPGLLALRRLSRLGRRRERLFRSGSWLKKVVAVQLASTVSPGA